MKNLKLQSLLILLFSIVTCLSATAQKLPHSCARPDEVSIKHLHLDLKVDFELKQLIGFATLRLERKPDSKQLMLDTNNLSISKVVSGSSDGDSELKWKLAPHVSSLGQNMTIELPDGVDEVTVFYSSSPGAEAVQWLSPEQTTDKKHPFLFTQSQAILARTWVPCQDTPAVRMTYSAKISVPADLLAVMSASNPQEKNETGVYEFEMKQPIPAFYEMGDTEKMITAAEKLYGPYRWDRYDIIFLPSSFPFGGMENPRLTFATPTILAGDRSLVALIAHELAHSWSGNLVTNATWDDFWLNEGFTVYFEQRIMEAIYGRKYSEMLAKLSLEGLKEEIAELKARDQWLKLDLKGRNPDDGMTSIAYDKGYFFLRQCEETVGRESWDAFLKGYFEKFAFKSMTTESFVDYVKANLEEADQIDFDAWIYGPGLPDNSPQVVTDELAKVAQASAAFAGGKSVSDLASEFETASWTTHHWNHFLRTLPKLSVTQMEQLDSEFKFTGSGNSEITHDWLLHVIGSKYQPGYQRLEEFLTGQGRRKFLQPLYEKLVQTDSGMQMATEIYAKARPGYHAVSSQTIDEIVGFEK